MRITAIIQARMASTRLPGKVLMEILGRPLLSHQIERLRRSRTIDEIVLATTQSPSDDPVAAWAVREGVPLFRGSEPDVLDRYYQAARAAKAEHVMRLTGDCPLIDPEICDRTVRAYADSGADYAQTGSSFAEGLDCELVSFSALEQSWKEATLPSEREHVTLHVRNHPERYRLTTLDNDRDDSKYRITVDESDDFEVVKAIFEGLYPSLGSNLTFEAVRSFLDSNTDVLKTNIHIVRNEGLLKSLAKDKELVEKK